MASVSSSYPYCSASDVVERIGKSIAVHLRYLCSLCHKIWQLRFSYIACQLGMHLKIIVMVMIGDGCRATVRIMVVVLITILHHLKISVRTR